MSHAVSSFECIGYDAKTDPLEHHLNVASEIHFGRIAQGVYNGKGETTFSFEILHVIKGDNLNHIALTYDHWAGPSDLKIGQTYIIFLYKNREIDECNLIIETYADSFDELILEGKRKDIQWSSDIEKIIQYEENSK